MRAVIFDIGGTLADYPIPLNWSALYRPAFERIAERYGIAITEDEYAHIGGVLAKYNTRIHPRTVEVSSEQIFSELLSGTSITADPLLIRREFYAYFRNDVRLYPEAERVLSDMSRRFITGTLSDVAYGMDNEFALADIAPLLGYIRYPYTSNDTGYRKPCGKGLVMLADEMGIRTSEMMFVGDEKKDIECAHDAGAVSVLINRSGEPRSFGQDFTVSDLTGLYTLPGIAAQGGNT